MAGRPRRQSNRGGYIAETCSFRNTGGESAAGDGILLEAVRVEIPEMGWADGLLDYFYGQARRTGNRWRTDEAENSGGPSETKEQDAPIAEALQQQLGLRLKAAKRPIEFIVIDSVNRLSTEN
jgi:hypothetical protein